MNPQERHQQSALVRRVQRVGDEADDRAESRLPARPRVPGAKPQSGCRIPRRTNPPAPRARRARTSGSPRAFPARSRRASRPDRPVHPSRTPEKSVPPWARRSGIQARKLRRTSGNRAVPKGASPPSPAPNSNLQAREHRPGRAFLKTQKHRSRRSSSPLSLTEGWPPHRLLGSSASRTASPNRFQDKPHRISTNPGKKDTYQYSNGFPGEPCKKPRAKLINCPQSL